MRNIASCLSIVQQQLPLTLETGLGNYLLSCFPTRMPPDGLPEGTYLPRLSVPVVNFPRRVVYEHHSWITSGYFALGRENVCEHDCFIVANTKLSSCTLLDLTMLYQCFAFPACPSMGWKDH